MKKLAAFVKRHSGIIIFATGYIVWAMLTHDHYGLSWDEERDFFLTENYVRFLLFEDAKIGNRMETNPILKIFPSARSRAIHFREFYNWIIEDREVERDIKFYSRAHMIPVLGLSGALFRERKANDYDRIHLMYKLRGFLLFLFLYLFLIRVFSSPLLATMGPVMLFFTPPLLGHIPINPKDVPFSIIFTLSMLLLFLWSGRMDSRRNVLLGIVYAMATAFRPTGILTYVIHTIYRKTDGARWRAILKELGIMALSAIPIMVVMNPYIGSNLLLHLMEYFAYASRLPWYSAILFNGQIIFPMKDGLPPLYLPTMFVITLPLFVLILLIISPLFWKNPAVRLSLIIIGTGFITYFAGRPIVYDHTRHYLFLIPFMVLAASATFIHILKIVPDFWKKAIAVAMAIAMLKVGFDMLRIHPYEYTYFNELVGGLKGAFGKYDTEYWCTSNREAASYLNHTTDNRNTYYVSGCMCSTSTIEPFLKGNLRYTRDHQQADFIICHARALYLNNPGFRTFGASALGNAVIHVVERDGVPLSLVLRGMKRK